jgi:hypothetical protein
MFILFVVDVLSVVVQPQEAQMILMDAHHLLLELD